MRGLFVSGDLGESLLAMAFPDSTLKSAIDTAVAAGTESTLRKKFVKWSSANDYEVTPCADGDVIQCRIIDIEPYVNTSGTATYKLTVECLWFVDANSAKYPASRMVVLPYSGSPSRGNTVAANSTTYVNAKDATSTGAGRILAIDSTNTKIAVLM